MRHLLIVVFLAVPRLAAAVDVDAGLATSVPIFMGGQVVAELPHGVQLIGEIGWLPGAYVSLINATAEAFNAYDDATSDLVKSAIKNSLVLRPSVGWRPFRDHGFEFMGGYTLAFLGGGLSAVEVIEAVTGNRYDVQGNDVPISALVHCFHVSAGWRWIVRDHWVVRANLGYLQSFASHTTIEGAAQGGALRQRAYERLSNEVSTYLDDVFQTYVKTPTLGVSVGYRF